MLEKNLDIIYNKPYLVIVPSSSKKLLEGFAYSFGNTILLENNSKEYNKVLEFITKNNFKKIVLVDYQNSYEKLIYKIKDSHELEFIYTGDLGNLSNESEYNVFKNILKLSKAYSKSKFAVLDEGLYKVLLKKYPNVHHIILDIEETSSSDNEYDENKVGILNESTKPTNSYYNELSALSLNCNLIVKLLEINKVTRKFIQTFKVNFCKVETEEELINANLVNLYINFTDNNILTILKSMDRGVPCLIGNTIIFDENKLLKQYLVVESDDDVNEILEKINIVKVNRKKILEEYKRFRKTYSKKSKETIQKFIGKVQTKKIEKEYEKLLSVIFPVYNTEKYLEKSLQSVVDARIEGMEIIVINDGSPDNSEEIILKFVEKYPELIRYIKQKNHGLGNVRNIGLKEAKGKYLAGVDSDDTINKEYFKEALKYLKKDIDVVICDWLTVTDTSKYDTPAIDQVHNDKNIYKGLLYTSIMPNSGNKIMKKALFDELDLKYVEDKYEDLSANTFILLRAETIKYINKQYYEYYVRSNSIMRSKPGNSMINIIKEVDNRIEKYKSYINVDIEEFKFHTYVWRIEEFIINPLYDLEEKEMLASLEMIERDITQIYSNIINGEYYKKLFDNMENKEKKKYIEERNKSLKNGKLKEFIIEKRKNNKVQKLTTYEVVYGIEEKND